MRRSTGFPPKVREMIVGRAGGWCERCQSAFGGQIHHRRPRGMGGTRREDTNTASAGLLLCQPCHAEVESDRIDAYAKGYLVAQSQSPASVPVLVSGRWVLLTDDGGARAVKR